ncbi:MAG: alpha/beta hydrolase [Spirochaetaceae bacterium]|nr:alpha/beta hydrolase [Spirochaetaceae bacterium]
MKSIDRRAAIKKLKTLIFTQKSEPIPFRTKIEKEFSSIFLPNGVEFSETTIGNVKCDLLVPEVAAKSRVMIYIYGGSFVGGSRASWRSFCASLAHASSTETYVPELHRSPEHPFPASLEDVIQVLKILLSIKQDVVLMGDSSGASLIIGSVLSLPVSSRSKIKEIVLMSPWFDLSAEAPLFNQRKNSDEIISAESLRRCADVYTYRSNLKNPLVSPMFGTEQDYENFPPIFIQAGEKEILKEQIESFAHMMFRYRINCELDFWKDMPHMFQMVDEYLPQAHLAVEKIGRHIQEKD